MTSLASVVEGSPSGNDDDHVELKLSDVYTGDGTSSSAEDPTEADGDTAMASEQQNPMRPPSCPCFSSHARILSIGMEAGVRLTTFTPPLANPMPQCGRVCFF